MLNNKTVLITGGTGSFGNKFVDIVLKRFPNIKRIIIYSRGEMKQYEMSQKYPLCKYPCMRYFIGDVRDLNRLKMATQNVDIVIHAAAIKHVPVAEENPMECIKTNIIGAQNVIDASLENKIYCVVALSTDKASSPINLYGASKLCSDKLFIAANNLKGHKNIKFCVVRYGNVMGSRGSVMPYFIKMRSSGILPVTDENMTRFNISLDDGVELVLHAIEKSLGGEIFVPKIPSYKLVDVARAISPSSKINIIGMRPGEKLHEEMISKNDSYNTIDAGEYYIILPTFSWFYKKEDYVKFHDGKDVPVGFSYSSDKNNDWLTTEDIISSIKKYIDQNFIPL